MSHYYDRAGNPVDVQTWVAAFEHTARVVKQERPDGWLVSTVWLGLDLGLGDGPPLIFETMIFAPEGADIDWDGEYQERYSTEAQALEGHARALAWLQEKLAGVTS